MIKIVILQVSDNRGSRQNVRSLATLARGYADLC